MAIIILKLESSAPQLFLSGIGAPILYDMITADSEDIWDAGLNHLTCPETGLYLVVWNVSTGTTGAQGSLLLQSSGPDVPISDAILDEPTSTGQLYTSQMVALEQGETYTPTFSGTGPGGTNMTLDAAQNGRGFSLQFIGPILP